MFLYSAVVYQYGRVDGGVQAKAIFTDATRDDTIKSSTARMEPIGGSTSYNVITVYIPGR